LFLDIFLIPLFVKNRYYAYIIYVESENKMDKNRINDDILIYLENNYA